MQVTQETNPHQNPIKVFKQKHIERKQKKQRKRIEQQKQYMATLFAKRNQTPPLPKAKTLFCLTPNARRFVYAYLMFVLGFLLFVATPGQNKQLLGYQFYHISNHDLYQNDHHTMIVKRVPFVTYEKDDIVVIQQKQTIPTFAIKRIQARDIANYTLTIEAQNIPKEQIQGKVITSFPTIIGPIQAANTMLLMTTLMLCSVLTYQVIREVQFQSQYRNSTKPPKKQLDEAP